ncbi:hypothetical protein ILUMI_27193 [Ignelater luminosus]|uniref:3'-5' exonuclease domain-containing protein n=1 Tax=Ignelater luminosus TaxID=2038154 RepID=A0A8K0FY73_IGNLU|nr:hypothetical protein ILUMI_27193 [Ignelater luminosus]
MQFTEDKSRSRMTLRSAVPKTEQKPERKQPVQELPYIKYFGNIYYFTDSIDCAIYCDKILSQVDKTPGNTIIGFDMEWPFNFQTGSGKTALIQLSSTIYDCYLFHVTEFKKLPKALTELLSHSNVRLVGVNIKNDIHKLSRDFPGINSTAMLNNCIDLRTQANITLNCKQNWSMAKLVNHFLRMQINKDKRVRNSKWNVVPLNNAQKLYAAIDAYVRITLVEMGDKTKVFQYNYENNTVDICINIPFYDSVEELTYILIKRHDLPIYVDKDLIQKLSDFSLQCNLDYYDNSTTELINHSKLNAAEVEDIIKDWERLMREETADYGEKGCASDEELFATAYHKLVHSPALETMLQLEYMYAQTVRQRVNDKDQQIKSLSETQTDEMNKAVDRLEEDMTEAEINEIAARHFDDQTLLQVKLTSELETIKEAQRREYREWVMQMLEQNQANSSLPTPKNSPLAPVPPGPIRETKEDRRKILQSVVLEESFTIHLGSQLKQMHNIRILSADVMDFCAVNDNEQISDTTPQLLQTALGLYSNDLCGLVLMTDSVIGSRLTKDFTEICQRSTEFHFPHIDDQLEIISNTAKKYQMESCNNRNSSSKHLQPGDVYITRHSNLSQVHIIFHMVSDDSLRANDINSRHPVVLGLRNILKTACSNDITSLTIPLLLQYEMTEEMTVTWCAKRAELVFKCVKGFMIEMASWGGSDLKNLQFLLPQGISSDVFQSLTGMLPSIFKVSNPLILKSSSIVK